MPDTTTDVGGIALNKTKQKTKLFFMELTV